MAVSFYDPADIADEELKFAVISARYRGKWVFCRHRDRKTWELPGGHREPGECILETARRELWEETGATKAEIYTVCVYRSRDYGILFFADIQKLGPIPPFSEIQEIILTDTLPQELTYAGIHDKLFEKGKGVAVDGSSTE